MFRWVAFHLVKMHFCPSNHFEVMVYRNHHHASESKKVQEHSEGTNDSFFVNQNLSWGKKYHLSLSFWTTSTLCQNANPHRFTSLALTQSEQTIEVALQDFVTLFFTKAIWMATSCSKDTLHIKNILNEVGSIDLTWQTVGSMKSWHGVLILSKILDYLFQILAPSLEGFA